MKRLSIYLISLNLFVISCADMKSKANLPSKGEFEWNDFSIDWTVTHCRNVSLFKKVADKTYLCMEANVHFDYYDSLYQSSNSFNFKDSIFGDWNIWLEERSDCYGVPEFCSDIPYSLINLEGKIIECEVRKMLPIDGVVSIFQLGKKLHIEMSKVYWKGGDTTMITNELRFGLVMTGSNPG